MENIKSQTLKRVKNTEKKIKVSLRDGISAAVFLALGIVFGQGAVFDELYPFGFAFVIASPGVYSFFALLGTSVGLVFSQTGVYLFRYIVCTVALWLIRSRILSSRSRLGEIWFLSVVTCFLVCALTGIAVVLPTRGGFDEIILFVAEGIIAAFSAFFYRRCISVIMKIREKPFEKKEMPCFCIAFATLVAALGSLEISGFYPALFVAFFAVLVMSHLLSESGGGICAAASAAALSGAIADGYNVLPLIFSGVVSGAFSPLGKLGCAISFLLTFSATALFTGEINSLQSIITVAVASVFFLLIPEKIYKKVRVFLRESTASAKESTYRKDVSSRLSETAETVENICNGMNKISEDLKKIDSSYDRNIFCRVKQEVCAECEGREKCWENSFQYTMRGFEEVSKNYRDGKNFSDTPFGKLFLEKCRKNSALQESLLRNFRRYDEKLHEEIRLDEKRKLMSEQMECMSDILRDFSKKFSKSSLVDNELSAEIKNIFNSFSVRCTKALCIVDTDGNMTIEASCKKIDREIDRRKLKEAIERASLRKFSEPEIDFTDTGTKITFRQKPWLRMKVGKFQLSSEDSPICGDCLRDFSDDFGNRTIILSDGMGTGGRAAVDAAMAAEYFGGLVEKNVSYDNALKIINSILELKSTNESLATIDAAHFNLFSGRVDFYKAGAAVSFVRKNGNCSVIESASLPAGILSTVSFAREKVMLSKGDIVVMVSDGVTSGKTDWIQEEIEKFSSSNPDILAQKIAGKVCDKTQGEKRDDITVVVSIMTA
ncbi:MAG: hypothetical protein E7555_01925 [Ruminococcaceae bacterium]|nr:hypothetical protein [Oscillospiraceae bacterium]